MTSLQQAQAAYTPAAGKGDNTFLQLAAMLLRARRFVLAMTLAVGALAVAITVIPPRKYTTTVSFSPVATNDISASGLGGLAGQLGLSLPGQDPSQTPEFYATLVQTPDILVQLAQRRYQFVHGGKRYDGSFIQLYKIDLGDSSTTLADALRQLRSDVITITYDRQTSIVAIDVRTRWKELSYQMASALVDLVNEFNLNRRRIQAEQERRFLAQRLDTARSELHDAENELQGFLVRNRGYQTDPTLIFEHDRLQREVGLRQDVYTMLTQGLEQARMRAVRNTASISLVQEPREALQPDARHTVAKLALGLVAGFALAVLWLIFRELDARGRSGASPEYESFAREWRASVDDVMRFVPFRRRRQRS